ncbi:DNA polymerase III subunit delta [Desulfomicrobium sp. ZS1]|uniref:DNA polymerase III subunit delta n=1 Tax=Desulfomicrobium sp. ZS1 TaxID=2952228 RepID=UPI0020B1A2BC|nr:DNA polymerase III subunit delta [Desulfomicrobium sp. ZS1]UTF50353.1 DNA polymerase III subunit delta [Desulfomicrobium sp. ZS1]
MTRQGFSFLVCADPELLKDRVDELLEGHGFAVRIFWGDEELPDRFWQTLTVPSMMGPPNAVVLRRAQDQNDEFWTRMGALLAMARPSVWPIFCLEGEWKSGKSAVPKTVSKGKYWDAAQKRGWVWEHPGLSRATIGQELDRFAARHGLTYAHGVKKILAESLPLSTIALRNELEKILLLAGTEKSIQPEHLEALDAEEAFDLFAFLRSLQTPAGRQKAWDRLLNDPAMAGGDMVFPVSSLMLREARQLWQLLHGEDGKVQLYPSLKTEKKRLAQRLGPARISRFWDIVLQADTDIKTGRLKPAQAMENLVKEAQRLW